MSNQMTDNKTNSKSPNFDPKIHICKFGFEFYGACILKYWYSILGGLYLKELRIDFWEPQINGGKKIIDTVEFKLSTGRVNEMLSLLEVEKFERFRDLPPDWENDISNGYRDGWGYKFWYTSEYGTPLFQIYMSNVFPKDKLPPYEKLLNWLRNNYKENKQLKDKNMLW